MRRKVPTFEVARDLQIEAESLLTGGGHEVDSRLAPELARDPGLGSIFHVTPVGQLGVSPMFSR